MLDWSPWKPLIAALVLPPVPWLLMIFFGTWFGRRRWGPWLVLLGLILVWLSTTQAVSRKLQAVLLPHVFALTESEQTRLAKRGKERPSQLAIVVLGGGRNTYAPEYGVSDLRAPSLERLRYGLYLARKFQSPVAVSGGVGWGQKPNADSAEADIAARIAREEWGVTPRWIENQSHDTQENAYATLNLLRKDKIDEVILVTHAWHMPRAHQAFAWASKGDITITPAPMGFWRQDDLASLDWLPSSEGFTQVRWVVREWMGLLAHQWAKPKPP